MLGRRPMLSSSAFSFVGSTIEDSGDPSLSKHMALPAGARAGDLCVSVAGYQTNGSGNVGFTLAYTMANTAQGSQYYRIYKKILTSTDITNGYVTVDARVTGDSTQMILVFRGVSQIANAFYQEDGGGASSASTAYTPSGTDVLGLLAIFIDRDSSVAGFSFSTTGSQPITTVKDLTGVASTYLGAAGVLSPPVGQRSVPAQTISYAGATTGNNQMWALFELK